MQYTLKDTISLTDIGLHSGSQVQLVIKPAPVDTGIVFKRVDVTDKNNVIPALWNNVVDTRLCTVIGNEDRVSVGTIEHLMAALRGCSVDNAIVEVDAPEVPVMDGSSAAFVEAIDAVGTEGQGHARRAIKVLRDIEVTQDGKTARLTPSQESSFTGRIAYDHPDIGTQDYALRLVNGNFRHELADARTFGFMKDVEAMHAAGLALGGSLDNAIVLNDEGVINPEGLRYQDEFIRHKLLDAIGDLYLAGCPILGAYEGECAGHALNNALLRKLFESQENWAYTCEFHSAVEGLSAESCFVVA